MSVCAVAMMTFDEDLVHRVAQRMVDMALVPLRDGSLTFSGVMTAMSMAIGGLLEAAYKDRTSMEDAVDLLALRSIEYAMKLRERREHGEH